VHRHVITASVVILLAAGLCGGAEQKVDSSEALAKAIADASPGDRILVAPGKYELTAVLSATPVTIEGSDPKRPPEISPKTDDAFVLDVADTPEGTVTLRWLVFDGGKKKVGCVRTRNTALVVEDCEFRDFSGIDAMIVAHYGKDKTKQRGIVVRRCVFKRNPNHEKDSGRCGAAVYGLGPAVVEDCTLEDMRGGLVFHNWSREPYKVIIRRNHIYRTEGTDWKCHGITTRTTAPEVYENLIHDLSKGDCSAMTIASNGLDKKGVPTAAQVYRNIIIDKWKASDSGMIHEAIEYGEYMPTKGRIYENVFVGRVRMSPALYNKGSHNEWFNNTFYGKNRFFHCYGHDCRYTNNIMFGGRADGNYYARKDWDAHKDKVTTGTLEHSCFYKVAHVRDREFHKGEGYFEADPRFVDPENLDFHLRYDSPCINKGIGSRDGLTPTDIGAFEYPIQVTKFKVDAKGVATWEWANDFQKASALVKIRWHATRFPETHDGKDDVTVATAPAALTSIPTGRTSGHFAAFVQDARGRWSTATPDNVHRFALKMR